MGVESPLFCLDDPVAAPFLTHPSSRLNAPSATGMSSTISQRSLLVFLKGEEGADSLIHCTRE
jgi:hypothetical protein